MRLQLFPFHIVVSESEGLAAAAAAMPLTVEDFNGPIFIGLIFASILYGFTTFQILTFLQVNKRDPLLQRLCVTVLCLLDGIQLAITVHLVYYGTYVNLFSISSPVPWSFPTHFLLEKIILSLTQGCYIMRVWRLRPQQKLLPAILSVLVICNLVVGAYVSTSFFSYKNMGEVLSRCPRSLLYASFGLSSASDISIAATLMYTLATAQTNLSWTESSWVMVFAYLLNTGIVVGIISFIRILSFTLFEEASIPLEAVTTKLYVLSLVAMLNAKLYLQKSQPNKTPVVLKLEGQSVLSEKGSMHRDGPATPAPVLTINEVGLPLFSTSPGKSEVSEVGSIKVMVEQEYSSSRV